jgi:ketosteroid isomerase-like protein
MRSLSCVLLALCLSAGTIEAADQTGLSPAQQAVIDARKARVQAALGSDAAVWSRYVADDCIFSDDDGVLHTGKTRTLENWGKKPREYDYEVNPRDYVVHLYGNTAVMNFRVTVHEQFTDADIISEMRITETYVEQNGSWLLVAKHWGMLPVNFRKPVAIDTSVYKDYVGQYESRPGSADTVTVKDGKLWSQVGGDEQEYLPLGSETFFVKDDLGSVTFSRDAQGRVTGYTYHRADGQELHDKKIK